MPPLSRRQFVERCAEVVASSSVASGLFAQGKSSTGIEAFAEQQNIRRKELWSLLGDLPWQHEPTTPKIVATERHEGYTLQRLVLDLNGIEPVPALLLIPDKRQSPAPGLSIHPLARRNVRSRERATAVGGRSGTSVRAGVRAERVGNTGD